MTSWAEGALWLSVNFGKIGRTTPDGVISKFNTPSGSFPVGILTGPDGALWFTESDVRRIGRITTAGVNTAFPIPTPLTFTDRITTGPNRPLTRTQTHAPKITHLAPT